MNHLFFFKYDFMFIYIFFKTETYKHNGTHHTSIIQFY